MRECLIPFGMSRPVTSEEHCQASQPSWIAGSPGCHEPATSLCRLRQSSSDEQTAPKVRGIESLQLELVMAMLEEQQEPVHTEVQMAVVRKEERSEVQTEEP